ncbi:MAG: tyrosine-type recombinase/integrase [Polyangiales bacterium]
MTHQPTLISLQRAIQDFFEKYLTIERNASRHTILAYRDAFKLFLQHAAEKHGVTVDQLDDSILELDTVRSFLEWLERVRGSSPRSRNQRLTAIKTFARYLASIAPEHLERCRRIRAMPMAAFQRTEVGYLEPDEIARLLAGAGDDRRNRALVLLLYNTGSRVQELVDLDLSSLRLDPVALVTFDGKGRRQRTCPLWNKTVVAIQQWLAERGPHPGPLFVNRQGLRLSRSGVAYILRTIATRAQLEPRRAQRVTPHVIRHTTAMHLLQSHVDITTIAAWLGHATLDTTHGYVEIDLRMKQKALAAASLPPGLRGGSFPEGRLLAWLTSLGKIQNYAQPPPANPSTGMLGG